MRIGFDKKLQFRKPIDIPFVTYSNHLPCVEANAYLHSLLMINKKQDTLRSKAHDIYHLVRFIENQPSITKFSHLNDPAFRLFVQNLQVERKPDGELKRSNNTVLSIASRCIDFLCFVQSFNNLNNFLFISLTTGNPIAADSWTTYINNWQKELRIEGAISPHLWRHAFVTDKLKERNTH